jgi:hypothetical protein
LPENCGFYRPKITGNVQRLITFIRISYSCGNWYYIILIYVPCIFFILYYDQQPCRSVIIGEIIVHFLVIVKRKKKRFLLLYIISNDSLSCQKVGFFVYRNIGRYLEKKITRHKSTNVKHITLIQSAVGFRCYFKAFWSSCFRLTPTADQSSPEHYYIQITPLLITYRNPVFASTSWTSNGVAARNINK